MLSSCATASSMSAEGTGRPSKLTRCRTCSLFSGGCFSRSSSSPLPAELVSPVGWGPLDFLPAGFAAGLATMLGCAAPSSGEPLLLLCRQRVQSVAKSEESLQTLARLAPDSYARAQNLRRRAREGGEEAWSEGALRERGRIARREVCHVWPGRLLLLVLQEMLSAPHRQPTGAFLASAAHDLGERRIVAVGRHALAGKMQLRLLAAALSAWVGVCAAQHHTLFLKKSRRARKRAESGVTAIGVGSRQQVWAHPTLNASSVHSRNR